MLLNIGQLGFQSSVSKGFNPTNVSNLALDLDPSDISSIAEVANQASQINDKSGNGNHALQGVGVRQFTTGTRDINGLNVLDCDGFNDYMALTSPIGSANGYTVFVVNSPDSISTTPKAYLGGQTGSFTFRIDNTPLQTQVVRTNQAILLGGADTPVINTNYISSCRTSALGSDIQINGVGVGSNAANPAYSNTLFIIGSSTSTTDHFNGKLGRILVYNRVLTDDEMNYVGNGLKNQWGVPWANI